jgi:hypothetical protein
MEVVWATDSKSLKSMRLKCHVMKTLRIVVVNYHAYLSLTLKKIVGFCHRPLCYVRRSLAGTQTDLDAVVKRKLESKNQCSL